jgi:hypothetical protein
MRTTSWRLAAALLAGGLAAVLTAGVTAPALAADDLGPPHREGDVELLVTVPELQGGPSGAAELDDAELRWGINHEAGAGARAGGCNFLMAGVPGEDGDTGGSRIWTDADRSLYRAAEGDVRILVPTADGRSETAATFATRCLDPQGDPLTRGAGNSSEAELVIDGGTGAREADGGVDIQWSGSFTTVFYGGMTYWWASDPRLVLDADGDGALTATVGGFGTDMADMTKWVRLAERQVELATFTDGVLHDDGGTITPDWCGVDVSAVVPHQDQTDVEGGCWGAFPEPFVEFQTLTGQTSYWYSSGLQDWLKPPYPVTISFDAVNSRGRAERPPVDVPASVPPPTVGSGTGGSPGGGLEPTVVPTANGATSTARFLSAPNRVPVPAAGAQPVAFPAVAAATLGLSGDGLVPALTGDGPTPGELLPWGVAALALGATGAVVGFRRGWLVLPFT